MGGWKRRGRGRVEMRGDEEGSEWRGDGSRLGGGGCEYIWGMKVEMQAVWREHAFSAFFASGYGLPHAIDRMM